MPLRILPESPCSWAIYSVGHNRKDDHAETYDPKTGQGGGDDIKLVVPYGPKYPFPKPGQLPDTRDGILAAFPCGLPPDPFWDWGDSSYCISDTQPPVIWSVGPDRDQAAWLLPQPDGRGALVPPAGLAVSQRKDRSYNVLQNSPDQPMYDPTNGVESAWNLYLIVEPQGDAGEGP